MRAKARNKSTKKKARARTSTKSKAKKRKVTKKKVAKKKVTKKKVTKKKVAKKKVAKKPPAKKPIAIVKKPVKKRPLTAEEKKERARRRAQDRKFQKESERRLVSRRTALIESYHSAKGNTKASTAGGTEDYIDYAVSSYDRDFSLSLTELERTQILLVEEALRRIRRGEYGSCLNCNVTIPQRRLEVEAWARYCISCQELDDQGLLQDPIPSDSDDEESETDVEADEEA